MFDTRTVADLPFDATTMDIVCRRDADKLYLLSGDYTLHFNISQAVVHHSPAGFEFGYGGSGPADFALNVLHLFLPPLGPIPEDCVDESRLANEDVQCFDGVCSRAAWDLHQAFKSRFVAGLPEEGGTIRGDEIRAWIAENLKRSES